VHDHGPAGSAEPADNPMDAGDRVCAQAGDVLRAGHLRGVHQAGLCVA
jgi:hypothetical protein